MEEMITRSTIRVIDKISTYIADLCIKSDAAAPNCEYKDSEFGIEFPKKGNAKLIKEIESLGHEVGAYKDSESNHFISYAIFSHNKGSDIEPRGNMIDYRKWKAA